MKQATSWFNFEDKKLNALFLFSIVIFMGAVIRIGLATQGHNYDMNSWRIVGEIASNGENIYVGTARRFSYAPFMAYVFGGLFKLNSFLPFPSSESFHIWVALFLTTCDALIAFFLFRTLSLASSIFFYLSPVALLITGYHSQFDNVAVLMGLLGWHVLHKDPENKKNIGFSIALISLSLLTKHILMFFPLWVLFYDGIKSWRLKLLFLGIVYGVFAVSFLPFLGDEAAQSNILDNIVFYNHRVGNALSAVSLKLFFPVEVVENFIKYSFILKVIMLSGTLLTGYIIMKTRPEQAVFFYLIAIVLFSSQMADQYFAIPLVACALLYRSPFAWLYVLFASFLILISYDNLRWIHQLSPKSELFKLSHVKWGGVWEYYHAQVWLAALWGLEVIMRSGSVLLRSLNKNGKPTANPEV